MWRGKWCQATWAQGSKRGDGLDGEVAWHQEFTLGDCSPSSAKEDGVELAVVLE